MTGDRTSMAMARIEAALDRIERAAAAPRTAPGGEDLSSLQEKHDRLRAAVQESLGQLDQLIEGAQG